MSAPASRSHCDLEKFKAKVRQVTKRTRGHSPPSVIAELASYVRGAFNYLLRARGRVRRGQRTRQVATLTRPAVLLEAVGQTQDAQA